MFRRELSQQQQQSQDSPTTPSTTSPILRRTRRRTSRSLRAQAYAHGLPPSSRRHVAHIKSTNTLLARNPALAHKLKQMALPLSPLVQLTTGAVHPHFPATVLHFWLLTDAQLESLAVFYHQARPCPWTTQYPCPVRWSSDASLEEKRRRMGRFIGLRGCESPVVAGAAAHIKSEEEIAREARLAAQMADEEALRRKMAPGPWYR